MPTFSGLFDGIHGDPYRLLSKKSPNRYHLNRLLKTRGLQTLADVIDKVAEDSTPASNTALTRHRIKAERDLNENVQGGARVIESVIPTKTNLDSQIDDTGAGAQRSITAGDVAIVQGMVLDGTEAKRAPTYATDRSGNGGGGKLGGI